MMCKYFTYLTCFFLLLGLFSSNTASAVEEIWGEAELADSYTSPLEVGDDPNASGGQYIANPTVAGESNTDPPSTGIATYSVTIGEGGAYRMYLRLRCQEAGDNDDSFYLRMQGATLNIPEVADPNWINGNNINYQVDNSTDWFWKQVGHYGTWPGNDPIEMTMDPGTYTLEIAYREDGLLIDALLITNDPNVVVADLPDEIPGAEEPCSNLVITNGDFETGAGVNQSIADVNGWYDNNAGGFWEDAWQTNVSGVTPNGSNVVVFCSWDSVEGDPLVGAYLYQSIGTSTGESSVKIGFDWGHPDDTAAGRFDGLTVSVLASDGSFVPNDANDILDANGVTLLDYASYDNVALGTDGEIFPVVVTLDLSEANAGDEIFLRFNNYNPGGGDPWPILDNVQIAPPGITYVDAIDASDPNVAANTTLATGEDLIAGDPGTSGSGADGLWRQRADLANGGNIFEAGGSWEEDLNTEDCPRLMTSVDVPEGAYDVYVYFWADTAQWRIQASLENLEGDLPLYLANDPNSEATLANANDFEEPVPMLAEGNRTLWQAYLGRTAPTATIDVYIDDDPNHLTGNARTWYDGIGYKPVVPVDPGTNGLVAHYALDNDANDSSANGLDGVIETIGDVNDGAMFVEGMVGMAIDLMPIENGTQGSYVNCGADPNYFDFTDAITLGAWVNIRSIPDEWRAIISKGDDTWRLSNVGATNRFHFGFCGYASRPTPHGIDGTIEVEFDEWHYVCGTYDITDGAYLYVDGVLDVSLADTAGIAVNTNDVWIGGNNGDTGWKPYRLFDGVIDEVMIYDRALSEAEILYLGN